MIAQIISKAMIEQRATIPLIKVQVAFDGVSVGICDCTSIEICDGTWVGLFDCDGVIRVGFCDGVPNGGQALVPHEAPKQKSIYEAKFIFQL